MKENISKHITYKEATHSNTAIKRGIDNTPGPEELTAMKMLAENVFEPVRDHFGKPIKVNSFFRSKGLNRAVGGSSTSQHVKGEAIDISGIGMSNKDLFDYIKQNLDFDQLIWEFGNDSEPQWIHVSYKKDKNRKNVLRAVKSNGRTKYIALR